MPKKLASSLAGVLRPALVLLLAFLIFGSVILAYQAIRTLQQLNAVEAERDRWQRTDDVGWSPSRPPARSFHPPRLSLSVSSPELYGLLAYPEDAVVSMEGEV